MTGMKCITTFQSFDKWPQSSYRTARRATLASSPAAAMQSGWRFALFVTRLARKTSRCHRAAAIMWIARMSDGRLLQPALSHWLREGRSNTRSRWMLALRECSTVRRIQSSTAASPGRSWLRAMNGPATTRETTTHAARAFQTSSSRSTEIRILSLHAGCVPISAMLPANARPVHLHPPVQIRLNRRAAIRPAHLRVDHRITQAHPVRLATPRLHHPVRLAMVRPRRRVLRPFQ